MSFQEHRRWVNSGELIGVRIASGLRKGQDQFALRASDLISSGLDVAYLLVRLGPGWTERDGTEDGVTILVCGIPLEQAITQIHQRVGLKTPLSGQAI
ncbi:hypothetical protein [Methylobacterium sp. 285MFTsu5.1]|uniref:hypothetical protein n=1 Tax=Methylobacterium sp. 285MFTsu5.1 TaxID=1172187 RepID=UPI00035F695A|nr:hypothetical protein [Methylobacterium sp. 285MFTsu5.1]